MLDWTYSPFVAGFFAFRSISSADAAAAKADERVRVYVFDQAEWRTDWNQITLIDPSILHLSVGEFMAIENE